MNDICKTSAARGKAAHRGTGSGPSGKVSSSKSAITSAGGDRTGISLCTDMAIFAYYFSTNNTFAPYFGVQTGNLMSWSCVVVSIAATEPVPVLVIHP